MKKVLLVFFALCLVPLIAYAQSFRANRTTLVGAFPTMATVAYGSVGASYGTALSNTNPLVFLDVVNDADCIVVVSLNATNDHFVIPAKSVLSIPFGNWGMHVSGNVSIKYASAACTAGNVYVSGVY